MLLGVPRLKKSKSGLAGRWSQPTTDIHEEDASDVPIYPFIISVIK